MCEAEDLLKKSGSALAGFAPFLLIAVLLMSTLLDFLFLYQEGFGNLYYAAAVKSMLTSFKNFFFVSFDPAGFVSVDKPPLGLWIQAAFVLLFRLNGISLVLPQALSGVLSVFLLYVLVRDIHEERAALVSALVLAITPMFVALSRNNTMDMQVVLVTVLASLTFFKAVKKASFPHLILTLFLVGLGFNIKMLMSFLVLPAIVTVWLLRTQTAFLRKIVQITVSGIVLLSVSLSWITIVELYPAEERPYVGSTESNSAYELAFSYNGLARTTRQPLAASIRNLSSIGPGAPKVYWAESGTPGILRLFSRQLAGQVSWFLPFVLVGLLFSLRKQKPSSLYWVLWLLPYALYLSFSTGVIHRHYVVMLAPPIAALCGIVAIQLWDSYKSKERVGFLLPVAVLLTGLFQYSIVNAYYRVPALILLAAVLALSILLVVRKASVKLERKIPGIILYVPLILVLCAGPFYWACTPLIYGGNYAVPYASPDLSTEPYKGWRFVKYGHSDQVLPSCVNPMYDFLVENRSTEEFLMAVPSSYATAALLMLYNQNRNIPVMTVGGFTGTDPILSLEKLKKCVREGRVRYFLVPSYLENPEERSVRAESGANDQLYAWVIENGAKVEKSLWNSGFVTYPITDPMSLYDVKR
jgi:4-amino-4-deoxy-L-arabinose transferase-like glycosyltransferase